MLEPTPARYVRTKWGIVPDGDHKKFIKALHKALSAYKDTFTDPHVPLALKVTYFLKRGPVDKDSVLPTRRPDLDNLSKTLLDALKPQRVKRMIVSDGIIADDAQITDYYSRKRFTKTKPKIKIEIWKIKTSHFPELPVQGSLFEVPTSLRLMKS